MSYRPPERLIQKGRRPVTNKYYLCAPGMVLRGSYSSDSLYVLHVTRSHLGHFLLKQHEPGSKDTRGGRLFARKSFDFVGSCREELSRGVCDEREQLGLSTRLRCLGRHRQNFGYMATEASPQRQPFEPCRAYQRHIH